MRGFKTSTDSSLYFDAPMLSGCKCKFPLEINEASIYLSDVSFSAGYAQDASCKKSLHAHPSPLQRAQDSENQQKRRTKSEQNKKT